LDNSVFYQIFLVHLHTNKIQIMYNVFEHNISQFTIHNSQFAICNLQSAINLVHLKLYKVRSFFLSFQTVYKNFFLTSLYLAVILIHLINLSAFIGSISVLCVLFYFNGTLITHMIMIKYDFIISDHHLNQRHLRSITIINY
jgi:hypothetical protein